MRSAYSSQSQEGKSGDEYGLNQGMFQQQHHIHGPLSKSVSGLDMAGDEDEANLVLDLGSSHGFAGMTDGLNSWAPPVPLHLNTSNLKFPHVDLRLAPPECSCLEASKDLHQSMILSQNFSRPFCQFHFEERVIKKANSCQRLSGGDALKVLDISVSESQEESYEMDLQLALPAVAGEFENIISFPHTDDDGKGVQGSVSEVTSGHAYVSLSLDEGSTSARWMKSKDTLTLSMLSAHLSSPRCNIFNSDNVAANEELKPFLGGDASLISVPSCKALEGFSDGVSNEHVLAVAATVPAQEKCAKTCKFQGCGKRARGASGLCIAHGGGQRCQRPNCNKGAEGRTRYCKAHGGGRPCQHLGCIKRAEGKTDFCIAHGGGRRCNYVGCKKAARDKSGFCIRHGGGKRCQMDGCTKSAEGFLGLCISHGGGRRCQFVGCGKGAQGSTHFCKAHGGGRRCVFEGCTKGAEGSTPLCKAHGGGKRCTFGGGTCTKSVHGGTLFCVAHGGGKRCALQGCSKSARGRTAFCVKHGGGKRCKFENCSKSAQGSTDFCKAHGGGKKCTWGSMRDGSPCDKFARGKTGLCAAHSVLNVESGKLPMYVTSEAIYEAPQSSSRGHEQICSLKIQGKHHLKNTHTHMLQSTRSSMEGSWSGSDYVEIESVEQKSFCSPAGYGHMPESCAGISSVHENDQSKFPWLFHDVQQVYRMPVYKPANISMAAPSTHSWRLEPRQHDNLPLLQLSLSLISNDDMLSLSLPEGRVHGGGLMALLGKESTKQRQLH